MEVRAMKRVVLSTFFVGMLVAVVPAYGSPITFVLDCRFDNTTSVCNAGGPFGTVMLTDSVIDPTRVDVNITLLPGAFTEINTFLLNTPITLGVGDGWRLLQQSAPAGTLNTNLNGSVTFQANNLGPGLVFDLQGNVPNANPLTYAGSIALFRNGSGFQDLSPSDFLFLDQSNAVYAGVTTAPLGPFRFNVGATTVAAELNQVPEPGTMLLLGAGLAIVASRLRRHP
jgi:hypothetical protein